MIFRYNYNLDLGENYYSHIRDHVGTERRERGETPGALSFSERISRRYCGDDRVGHRGLLNTPSHHLDYSRVDR